MNMNISDSSAESLFAKAKDAYDRKNYDYAITLLLTFLKTRPESLEGRKLLRSAQEDGFGGKKVNSVMFVLQNITAYIKFFIHMHKGDWILVTQEIEKLLTDNPNDYLLLSKLALALNNLDLVDAAIDAYKQVLDVAEKDITALRALARIYREKKDDFNQARRYCEKLLLIIPHDNESERMIKDMAAIGTIKKGGWDDTKSYRDKIKDSDKAQIFEQEVKAVKSQQDILSLIKDNEAKLSSAPDNVSILKLLGKLYLDIREFDKAEEFLNKAIVLSPADASLQKELSNVKKLYFQYNIELVSQKLEQDPSNLEFQATLRDLKEKFIDFDLEDCKKRADLYPTDMDIRFELGEKYVDRGLINEAISAFQMAVRSSTHKVRSLNYLGTCFKQKGMLDLAKDQLLKAVEEVREMNKMKKEIVYNLATVYEEQGNMKQALEEYKKIYEVDISYKDVTEKIEKAYEQQ